MDLSQDRLRIEWMNEWMNVVTDDCVLSVINRFRRIGLFDATDEVSHEPM
jgi:hypothetical protein